MRILEAQKYLRRGACPKPGGVLNVIQRPSEGKCAFADRVCQTRIVEASHKNRRTIRVWYTEDLPKTAPKPGRIHQPGGGSAPRVTPIGARRQRNLSAA